MRRAALATVLLSCALPAAPGRAGQQFREVAAWTGNGCGDFSDQDPPHHWDANTAANVRWTVRLPNWSNGGPVVAAGRVFLMCEPVTGLPTLHCIDAEIGKMLWTREVDWTRLLPGDEADKARRRLAELYQWSADLLRQYAVLKRLGARKGDNPDDGPPKGGDADAWRLAAARARQLGWNGQFGVRAGGSLSLRMDPQHPMMRASCEFIGQYTPAFPAWGPGVGTYRWSQGFYGETWDGMTFPTPVSDGRFVWVLTGHDVVACYAIDGHLMWMRRFSARPRLDDLNDAQRRLARRGGVER